MIANTKNVLAKARSEHVPGIWVQHNDEELVTGTDDWRLVPELQRHDSEPLFHTNGYWLWESAPDRVGGVVATSDVVFA